MKKNNRFKIVLVILVIMLIFVGMCSLVLTEENQSYFIQIQECFSKFSKKSNLNEKKKEKIIDELSFFENELINIANKVNNLKMDEIYVKTEISDETGESGKTSESEKESESGSSKEESISQIEKMESEISNIKIDNDIDWDDVEKNVRMLYESWGIIAIDLNDYSIDNKNMQDISNSISMLLDDTISKDKNKIVNDVSDIYEKMVNVYEILNVEVEKEQLKLSLIRMYNKIQQEDFDSIGNEISNMFNNIEKLLKNESSSLNMINVKKAYVMINSLNDSYNKNEEKDKDENDEKNDVLKQSYLYRYVSLMKEVNNI